MNNQQINPNCHTLTPDRLYSEDMRVIIGLANDWYFRSGFQVIELQKKCQWPAARAQRTVELAKENGFLKSKKLKSGMKFFFTKKVK